MESNENKSDKLPTDHDWFDYLAIGLGIFGALFALLAYLEIRYRGCTRTIKCCYLKIRYIWKIW